MKFLHKFAIFCNFIVINDSRAYKKRAPFIVKIRYQKKWPEDGSGNFDVKDGSRSFDHLRKKLMKSLRAAQQDRLVSSDAQELDIHRQRASNHFKKADYKRLDCKAQTNVKKADGIRFVGLEQNLVLGVAERLTRTSTGNNQEGLNKPLKKTRPELVNRKGVIFHHDNVGLHTSLAIWQN